MSTQEIIETGKVVSFNYTLRDDRGEVLDQSEQGPLSYLHGAGNIVPGLEKQMQGHNVGDSFEAVVPPEEGYGHRNPETRRTLPRGTFGELEIRPGMQLATQTPDGQTVPFWILAVDAEQVEVDFGHPLAGVELHFAIEVTEVRDATEQEKAHGHPHGPGGHEH